MLRAMIYLLAAGVVWLAEGLVFAHFLLFSLWQTVLMAVVYATLFLLAARYIVRLASRYAEGEASVAFWRYVSLAPMLVAVIGSFASLPLLLLIVALGRL